MGGKIEAIGKYLSDHLPEILTGFAVVGTMVTAALAVEATPAAMDELDKAYLEKGEPLNKREVVKATWKCYIPATVSGVVTVGCIFGANHTHIQKETAMAATAAFFEKRYYNYKDKVAEITDEETERAIETDLALDKMVSNPSKKQKIKGEEILCYEPNTEQYFITTSKELMWAELTANKILSMEEKVYLNQILALFPDANHKNPIGNKIGWYLDESYYEFIGYNWGYYGRPWLEILHTQTDVNGDNVAVIHFSVAPVHEEAYDVEEMLSNRKRIEDELSLSHISDEIATEKKKSQK